MANDELFIDVLTQIERHPDRWRQDSWSIQTECGTAYCMAGWTCVLTKQSWASANSISHVGTERSPGRVAAEMLGIPESHAATHNTETLFNIWNTLDDLYRISADCMGIDERVLRDKVRDAA